MYPKCPANRLSGIHRAKILPRRGSFRCTDPSNHARRANLAIPGCFVWVLRAGRGVPAQRMRLAHAPALCEAARVVELVGASHEGDTHSPVAASVLWAKRRHRRWATSPRRCICPPRRLRAASSRPRLHHPVHITAEAAGLCRLPSKTWRCDGVSLNCRCSAVLF